MFSLLWISVGILTNPTTPSADVWPGFRGRGDSVSAATKLPVQWSAQENIAWKAILPGYGQSCPVVWKDTVFVTAVHGAEREKGFVIAYDARTGKRRWIHEFSPTQKAKWTNFVSKAAPTPLVDEGGVYAFFEGGDVLALTHEGKVRWTRSLVKDYGEFKGNHGIGSSPALTGNAVIVLVDHSGPSYLLALNKDTGKNLWKTDRKSRGSWASPVIAQRKGHAEIIVSSNGSVAGYETAEGKVLWEMDGLSGNTIPSASAAQDYILVGAGIRKGGDAKNASQSNCCLRLVEKNGKPGYELLWSAEKATANYATPLLHQGHAYFVNQVGIVYCIDVATGKQKYAERIDGPCWASPIAAGDHIYFFGKDGQTTVLRSGPEFHKVASNKLWEETPKAKDDATEKGDYQDGVVLYGVAAVEGAFFVRTGPTLYRIGSGK